MSLANIVSIGRAGRFVVGRTNAVLRPGQFVRVSEFEESDKVVPAERKTAYGVILRRGDASHPQRFKAGDVVDVGVLGQGLGYVCVE